LASEDIFIPNYFLIVWIWQMFQSFLSPSSFLFHSTPCLSCFRQLDWLHIVLMQPSPLSRTFSFLLSCLNLKACFFIYHLHPYFPIFLISSPFLHHFFLSSPLKVPHILLLLPPCHSLSEAYWFSAEASFPSLSCQKEMGSSDVPNHDKQILFFSRRTLWKTEPTPTHL